MDATALMEPALVQLHDDRFRSCGHAVEAAVTIADDSIRALLDLVAMPYSGGAARSGHGLHGYEPVRV
jgi:hypothetical protein